MIRLGLEVWAWGLLGVCNEYFVISRFFLKVVSHAHNFLKLFYLLAINYLSEIKGVNTFSFIPMNINGDDENVFPYISDDEADRLRIDVSKVRGTNSFEKDDLLGKGWKPINRTRSS